MSIYQPDISVHLKSNCGLLIQMKLFGIDAATFLIMCQTFVFIKPRLQETDALTHHCKVLSLSGQVA